jgi:branched-chain amino acid transport system ATP-binding protein
MLAIARALIGNPKVLVMDEPSEGLAPVVIDQLVEVIRKVASSGELDVLLVEQRIDIALELGDRCLVMERGQVKHCVAKADFSSDPEQWAALMGMEH